jgi:hypothetical protein
VAPLGACGNVIQIFQAAAIIAASAAAVLPCSLPRALMVISDKHPKKIGVLLQSYFQTVVKTKLDFLRTKKNRCISTV